MRSEDSTEYENLIWISPIWSDQGYLGTAPDEWEHEFRLPSNEVLAGIKKVGDSVQVPDETYLRYRFHWSGRPGAWNNEGVAALPPK